MFLSIIIPLYNCEKYISRSLDVILATQLPVDDYEVIIINDGSNDRGVEICQEYTEKYAHIKLYCQDNMGASAARNAGMDRAKGSYIWFVDADDVIVPSFFLKAYHLLKNNPVELLCFNFQKTYSRQVEDVNDFVQEQKLSGVDFLKGHYSNFIWNKIYRMTALRGKRFLDGTKNIEDMLFNMMTIIDIENVLCVPYIGYQYNCLNNNSTSRNRSIRNLVKLDQDSILVLTALNKFANKQSDIIKKNILQEYLNFSIAGHLYSLFKFYSPQRLQKRITYYRHLGLYPVEKSDNRKGNFFLIIANHDKLMVNIMRLLRWIRFC